MSRPDYDDYTTDGAKWVHERDYGSFAVGGILVGLIQLTVGIVQLIVYLIRSSRE